MTAIHQNKNVTVKLLDEIVSTLDSDSSLDGLKFMPEMKKFCGEKYRIEKQVRRAVVDRVGYGVIKDTYILDDVYCDGSYHDNCSLKCSILWKKEWLESTENPVDKITVNDSTIKLTEIKEGDYCQANLLYKAAIHIPSSTFKGLLSYNYLSNSTISEIIRDAALSFDYTFKGSRNLVGNKRKTPDKKLGLKKGDTVKVKNIDEILDTLDKDGKNRGLEFSAEMKKFCGEKYTVTSIVDKVIDEKTKNIRDVNNSVILDNLKCDGRYHKYCDLSCHHIWREIWLEKIESTN